MFVFEKFPVYLKSEEVYKKLSPILSDKLVNTHLRDQLRRALLSITLNIAEGTGKFSSKDKKNFYIIARGSVSECVAIIRLLKVENHITESLYILLHEEFSLISKMLSGLIKRFS